MSEVQDTSSVGRPWHMWVVGIIGLLWSGMGAFDYLMTQTKNEAYMADYTPEQLEYFYGYPTWIVAAWAIAVWFGVVGSVLLLLRKRHAEPVFLVSLVAMVTTAIFNYGFGDGFEVAGGAFDLAFTGLIFFASLGLWWYSRLMRVRGLLS